MQSPSHVTEESTLSGLKPPPIILASGSPRRQELLAGLGIAFKVILPDVDEKAVDATGLSPADKALKLARIKGESLAATMPDALVIAADTLVAIDHDILEKPVDEADAFRMLRQLQGNWHSVFSAVAVFHRGQSRVRVLETRVQVRPLTDAEIRRYIRTGEPMDKAGAYAIQGRGSLLVEQIEGCYFNVVGLSLVLLGKLCRELGVDLAADPATPSDNN